MQTAVGPFLHYFSYILKGASCSFEGEIQTQNFEIYNI